MRDQQRACFPADLQTSTRHHSAAGVLSRGRRSHVLNHQVTCRARTIVDSTTGICPGGATCRIRTELRPSMCSTPASRRALSSYWR